MLLQRAVRPVRAAIADVRMRLQVRTILFDVMIAVKPAKATGVAACRSAFHVTAVHVFLAVHPVFAVVELVTPAAGFFDGATESDLS